MSYKKILCSAVMLGSVFGFSSMSHAELSGELEPGELRSGELAPSKGQDSSQKAGRKGELRQNGELKPDGELKPKGELQGEEA